LRQTTTGKSMRRALRCMLAMRKLPVALIRRNPTALPLTPNQIYDSSRPAPLKGALAIVTNVGRDAVDADSAQDERAASGR